jgi:hypothetical protein
MSFDQCAQHCRDQRGSDSMAHHVANTNAGCVVRKPCDVKKITPHHACWQITMIKMQLRRFVPEVGRR